MKKLFKIMLITMVMSIWACSSRPVCHIPITGDEVREKLGMQGFAIKFVHCGPSDWIALAYGQMAEVDHPDWVPVAWGDSCRIVWATGNPFLLE